METANIPVCIAWSINQLMGNCLEDLTPQTKEMWEGCICSATKLLVFKHMSRRLDIMNKIKEIMPILNLYYNKDCYIWTNENYKDDPPKYKKQIDEFVAWLRGLKGWREEILNIHDWTY